MSSQNIKNLCMGYDEKQRALMVYGYTGYIKDDWFAMPAFGRRYHEYGIADGSVLLCGPSESFCDGDLVIAEENGGPAVFVFSTDPNYTEDGDKRILHDESQIQAKIMGSFNFYQ